MPLPVEILDSIKPREYQIGAAEHAVQSLRLQLPPTEGRNWHLYAAPTGTGKSVFQLLIMGMLPETILCTPRIEIIAGMLSKMKSPHGGSWQPQFMFLDTLVQTAQAYGIYTPIRLRNILAQGALPFRPTAVILDECHHSSADTYKLIEMYLNGVPCIGATATPFRGTPKGTQDFLQQWNNEVNVILTLKDAVEEGYCALPSVEFLPLVDDDIIGLSNGEFTVASANTIVLDRIKALAYECRRFFSPTIGWDRPTMFSVPSSVTAAKLVEELQAIGIRSEAVTQETPRTERVRIFEDCISSHSALVQIDVVSEGVDLPIRRLIDIRPTMSPVKWQQQIGRIMRPSKEPPEYICCCRNLERHCYLMEGLYPNSIIKEAQEVFGDEGKPSFSKRSGTRVTGLESLGKFTSTPVSLANGVTVFTYQLCRVAGYTRTEYFAILHPGHSDIIIGEKVSTKDVNTNEMQWGKWRLLPEVPPLEGCQTVKLSPLTEKQEAKWKSSAEGKGLNIHVPVNNRSFQILFFLLNTGLSLRN